MSSEIELYKQKGLTEDEIKILLNIQSRGIPGITRIRPDVLETLYVNGYSCEDLCSQFKDIELGLILHCRVKFDWDAKRQRYQENLARQTNNAKTLGKAEAIKFLSDVLTATHIHHRNELMKFIAAPDREKVPEFIPKTMHAYSNLMSVFSELTSSIPSTQKDAQAGGNGQTVNIVLKSKDVQTIEIDQDEVADALISEMKTVKEGKKDK